MSSASLSVKDQVLELLRKNGPLDHTQIAVDLLLGDEEGLAQIDDAFQTLITEGSCERRPDHEQRDIPLQEQPVGIRRPWPFPSRA
jgi:hypothetical protein